MLKNGLWIEEVGIRIMYIFAYFRYVEGLWFKEKRDYKQLKMQRGVRVIIFLVEI